MDNLVAAIAASPSGHDLLVSQTSHRATINWQGFTAGEVSSIDGILTQVLVRPTRLRCFEFRPPASDWNNSPDFALHSSRTRIHMYR